MLRTADPFISLFKKRRFPLSKKTKLIFVLGIIFVAYFSGKVTALNDLAHNGETFQESERKLSSVASVQEATIFSSKNISQSTEKFRRSQIKLIAIGQKQIPRPTPTPAPAKSFDTTWGVAEKIDTHTYTMRVQPDDQMATAGEILIALNNYRRQHGSGQLVWDESLAKFANSRTDYFSQKNSLDNHAGFLDYLKNQDGFKKLGFSSIGENSSLGFTLQGTHLIEWVYAGDEGHNSNQLGKGWYYVGIGVSGTATDLIFGGNKL